ncbi:hypothetical protein BT96DRAFT_809725 [Gymnopus androsaceus JB14]|uniref:Thioredoxin domain-containing protein n=1 Tax=Gymnopus androsaceus JB14 TaxID=1447944 RepID=A0A6A4I5P9_9AGAR|nr:hypothetical protein BT96DRAFT_809725 [Gymnopus androsaceus JB14]
MKLFWLSSAFLVCVNGQYFSDGWKPGQAVTQEVSAPAVTQVASETPAGEPPQNKKSPFDVTRILNSAPVSSLFAKAGVNISNFAAKAGLSSSPYPWDLRIPFITDSNYNDTIVNEELTPEEEKNRTWIIAVSASATNQGGGISQFVDKIFDETYNETIIAGDLPNLRWGRIDYLNVTYLTTLWGVWQAPTFVILQDRGRKLRFVKPQYLRLRDGALREFLTTELYNKMPPWDGPFAPGGSCEYLMHYLGLILMMFYNFFVLIPRWLLYILSGSVASFLIQLLHKPSKAPAQKDESKKDSDTTPASAANEPASAAASGSTPTKGGKAKQRKSKK